MRDKFFLPTTLVLCAIIFFVWQQFICEPVQREISSMELETRHLREVEREILELKARHENLSTFIEAKELELDAARNFLPLTLAQDKFIDELYRAADFYGVRLTSVQTGEVISADEFQAQVVTVRAAANYFSLLNFIREVLDGERLPSLEKVSITSTEGKILSCELRLKIFAALP